MSDTRYVYYSFFVRTIELLSIQKYPTLPFTMKNDKELWLNNKRFIRLMNFPTKNIFDIFNKTRFA